MSIGDDLKAIFKKCSDAYRKAVAVVANKGSFKAEDLRRPEMQALTDATYNALSRAINTGITEKIPASLTASLQQSAHVFSGMKTYTALRETAALLTDAQGRPRPFEAFKADVLRLDKTYNQNYLEAEYQFATHSARMAAQWQQYAQDGDRYDLQYRTASDDRVRASHQVLHNVTLPPSDPFWSQYYPPNGWRCRCTVQQVRKGKYPASDSDIANKAGEEATTQIGKDGKNKMAMFRFNPGADKKLFPPDHPYTYGGNCSTQLSSGNDKCRALAIATQMAANATGKFSVPQKQAIYAKQVADQYQLQYNDPKTGGKVFIHELVNPLSSDFKDVLEEAISRANKGKTMSMLPEIHASETAARAKLLPGYTRPTSNPDLYQKEEKEYWEVERTAGKKERTVKQRCLDGLAQADNVVLILDDKTFLKEAEKVLQKANKYVIK